VRQLARRGFIQLDEERVQGLEVVDPVEQDIELEVVRLPAQVVCRLTVFIRKCVPHLPPAPSVHDLVQRAAVIRFGREDVKKDPVERPLVDVPLGLVDPSEEREHVRGRGVRGPCKINRIA
jgi:hypothetical protein